MTEGRTQALLNEVEKMNSTLEKMITKNAP